ncbi:MAG: energy transducer TonB [Saprospiraceae bacterium]|nr:energy transducer TonB [Saprospiraceae bacterium]
MKFVRLSFLMFFAFLVCNSLLAQEPVYSLVEEAPRFFSKNCETQGNALDKQHCSKFAFKDYVKANLKYPREAQTKGIKGIVLLEVVVEKDGTVVVSRVLRDIGGGCADEAARLVKAMPKWVPGKKGGKIVRVKTPLTVKFDS